jgi:hypothetical protein
MRDVVTNTSPLLYLHQLGLLDLLPRMYGRVVVPSAVVGELSDGARLGYDVPAPSTLPWVFVEAPPGAVILPMVTALGDGERAAIALAKTAGHVPRRPLCRPSLLASPSRRRKPMTEMLGLHLTPEAKKLLAETIRGTQQDPRTGTTLIARRSTPSTEEQGGSVDLELCVERGDGSPAQGCALQ